MVGTVGIVVSLSPFPPSLLSLYPPVSDNYLKTAATWGSLREYFDFCTIRTVHKSDRTVLHIVPLFSPRPDSREFWLREYLRAGVRVPGGSREPVLAFHLAPLSFG